MFAIAINGAQAVASYLSNLQKQQAYATMRTINRVALEVQNEEVTRELPSHLKLRGGWFKPRTMFGINVSQFARRDNLQAVVGTRANWVQLVEEGGVKTPSGQQGSSTSRQTITKRQSASSAGRALAIPTANIDRTSVRRRRDKPGPLIASGRAFVIVANGKAGVYIRTGRGKRDIQALYLFRKSARVPHLLHFKEAGYAVVTKRFNPIFAEEFQRALETAR